MTTHKEGLAVAPEALASRWIRPGAGATRSEPRWGHSGGLQVGLAPLPGPRGLLRVYAPYLGHAPDTMINFIAVEPITAGSGERGYSELETSRLDGVAGKRFWSTDDLADSTPLPPEQPASGTVTAIDGVERLEVHVGVEPFDNGAHVLLRIAFRADRPYEVVLSAFHHDDSASLEACVLTATMGNFARLRRLRLADRVVEAADLWPDFDGNGFTGHARFPLHRLARRDGVVVVSATTDEAHPDEVTHAPGTAAHWRYSGRRAEQSWRAEDPVAELAAQVNGRSAYWASPSPIPGGIAFENVELIEPFRQGRELMFSVTPLDLAGAAEFAS